MGEIRVEAEDTWCVNTKRKRGKREWSPDYFGRTRNPDNCRGMTTSWRFCTKRFEKKITAERPQVKRRGRKISSGVEALEIKAGGEAVAVVRQEAARGQRTVCPGIQRQIKEQQPTQRREKY